MIVKEYRVDFKKPLKASYLQRFGLFEKKRAFRLIIFSRPKKRVFLKNNFSLHLILSMRNFFVITLFCYYTFFVSVTVRKIIGFIRTYGHTDGRTFVVDHRGSIDPKNNLGI